VAIHPTAQTDPSTLTGDVYTAYLAGGAITTLYDYVDWAGGGDFGVPVNTFAMWHTKTYDVGGQAALVSGMVQPLTPGGTFTLTMSFGGVTSNTLNGQIAEDAATLLIENFSTFNIGEDYIKTGTTYWYDPQPVGYPATKGATPGVDGNIIASDRPGSESGKAIQVDFKGARNWQGGFGNSHASVITTGYTNLTFWVKAVSGAPTQMRFTLEPGASRPDFNFTISGTGWQKITIPVSSLGGNGSGWMICGARLPAALVNTTFSIAVDQIQLEK